MKRTLILIKPDGIIRQVTGKIISRFGLIQNKELTFLYLYIKKTINTKRAHICQK